MQDGSLLENRTWRYWHEKILAIFTYVIFMPIIFVLNLVDEIKEK